MIALPRWLTESGALNIEKGPPTSKRDEDQLHRQRVDPAGAGQHTKTDVKILEDLQECDDIAAIHKWATRHHIDLREYSGLAYGRLLDCEKSLFKLLDALGDNALNNSDNLDCLLHRLAQAPLTPNDTETLGEWIKRTLYLGQRSQSQIKLISEFVLHVSTAHSSNGQEHSKCILLTSMIDGLESSKVLGIKDLYHRTWGVLLKATTRGVFGRISQDLGFRIIKALDRSQSERLVHTIALFVLAEIEAQASVLASKKSPKIARVPIPRSFEMLQGLHKEIACRVILNTSKAMINHTACIPQTNVPLIKLLDQWWSWIRRSEWLERVERGTNKKQLERLLTGKQLVIVASYLRHLKDFEIAHFILRREFGTSMSSDDKPRATDLFHELCMVQGEQSPFIGMLRAAHQYSGLLDRKIKRFFRLLQMLQKSSLIPEIIVELRKVDIKISEDVILHTIRTGLHWVHHRAEKIFAVYPELTLEKCPELAERMIKNVNRYPNEALWRYTARHPNWRADRCRDPPTVIKARKQLLQRMALAYSAAPHLTPRMAFRMVYSCYTRHMREKLGTCGKATVLALVRAGLVRPLDQGEWVSSERIKWLLHLVRKFEGRKVAENLDQAMYEWRGMNIQQRQQVVRRDIRINGGSAMSFTISNDWKTGMGAVQKSLSPIRDDDADEGGPLIEDDEIATGRIMIRYV